MHPAVTIVALATAIGVIAGSWAVGAAVGLAFVLVCQLITA